MRAVLTYHSIDPSGSAISISEAEFRRHIEWLASGQVRVVPLSALIAMTDDEDAIALTFDDGYQNFGSTAAPLLEMHQLPSTLFVVTDRVGGTNAWGAASDFPVLPLLDWSGIARVAEGGVELGSHGRTHRALSSLTLDELRDELVDSAQEVVREVGKTPVAFCYPYGDVTPRERREVSAEYELAVTTDFRALSSGDDSFLIPRLDAYYLREKDKLESWGTAAFDRYLKLRRGGRRIKESVRRVMGNERG